MWILVAAAALAHRPHVPVAGIAVDPDSGGADVWAVIDIEDNIALMRSTDFGNHFDPVWSPVRDETVVDLAWALDRLVILAADGSVWTSFDGDDWEEQRLPTDVRGRPGADARGTAVSSNALATSGTALVVATQVGLFVGDVNDVRAMVPHLEDVVFVAVAFSATDPSVILAIDEEGGMHRSPDGGRVFLPVPGFDEDRVPYALAEYDQQYFAGTDYGVYWFDRVEAIWKPCGYLPVASTGEATGEIPVLVAMEDGRLLATTGQEALFVSSDDCESWQVDGRVAGVDYGAVGDATAATDAYVDAWMSEDGLVRVVAGWNGVASSRDGGVTFEVAKLIPGDYTRAVAFSADWPEDRRIWFGGYGSGPYWTDDGGVNLYGSSVGNPGVYANSISIPDDHTETGRVAWLGNYRAYRSEDRGETWEEVFVPVGRLNHLVVRGRRWWAVGEDGEVGAALGRVVVSDDEGRTWAEPPTLISALAGASVRDVVEATLDGRPVILLAATSPSGVVASFDEGATWDWLIQGPEERSAAVAAWPPSDPTRLVFAARSAGVLVSDDRGASWSSRPFPAQRPDLLTEADDGTLFVVTRVGQVVRSEDGGDTWSEVGPPFAPIVHTMVAAPHFDVRGLLLAGTSDGVWISPDRGDHWQRMRRYELWEDETVHLVCAAVDGAPCPRIDDPARGNLGAVRLGVGSVLSFVFRGERARLAVEGIGRVAVSVDGAETAEYDVDGPITLELPGGAWNDVTVEVLAADGDGLVLDYAETWGLGEVVPLWGWLCGCASGPRSGWAAVPAALWLVVRRRRRGLGPTTRA
jgi:photosystem II stability/assembly factor-like uncharacterized protein